MSSIYKLSIQGVRSFNSEHSETIQFGFPLTLICGQNGCGKTTIIECLKYVTTGFLPPNSKGGAFINDPNISNRNVVNAQIKLAFKSINNDSMIITRSMQLAKKGKDKFTFKTLENQLSKINRGEKTTISGKNSDLDNELPTYLGISKSILDYVIFCHQDESLWPLSEPSVLKKKFDDIFQASKFTKVLDNLKVINKDLVVDIKLLEKSVEHLKIDKKRSSKLVNNLNDLKEKLDGLNEDIQGLAFEINGKEEKLNRLFNTNQEFHAILSKFDQLNYSKQTLTQQLERLEQSIEEIPDDLDKLTAQLANFDDDIAQNDQNIETFNRTNNELQDALKGLQKSLSDLHRLEGSLSSKKEVYINNVEKLKELAGGSVEEFIQTITKDKASLTKEFQRLKSSNAKTTSEREEVLSNKIKEIMLEESQQKSRQEVINDYNDKISDLSRKINSMNISEDKLEFERNQLTKMKEKLATANTANFLKDITKSIEENNVKLDAAEKEVDDINKRMKQLNTQNDLVVKRNYLNEANELKQSSISSNLKKLTKTFNADFSEDNLDSAFNGKYSEIESQYRAAVKKEQEASTLLNSNSTLITSHTKNYEELTSHKKKLLDKITKKISPEEIPEYNQILDDLEEDYQTTLESLSTFDITKQFKIKAIEVAKQSHNCVLCRRDLKEAELSNFMKILNDDVKNMDVSKLQKDLDEAKSEFESMKDINPSVLEFKKLEADIASMNEKLPELKKESESLKKTHEEASQELKSAQQAFDAANDMKQVVTQLKADFVELNENNQKVASINSDLSDSGVTDVSLDELSKIQSERSLEVKTLRTKINNDLEVKFSKQKELSRLESNIKDQELNISNIEKSLNDLINFQSSIKVYEKDKAALEEANSKIQDTIEKLNKEKVSIQAENDEMFKKFKSKENDLESQLSDVEAQLSKIESLKVQIEEFETKDEPKLNSCLADMKESNQKIDEINTKLAEINTKLKESERKKSEISNLKAILRDQIDYHNLKNELNSLQQEIEELNIQDAEKQKEVFQEESKVLREAISDLNSENANKLGQIKQIQDQIHTLQEELSTEYKDVDKHYHEEWIKLQTNLLVSNDINNYSKSLDNAIMKFHSMKMTEINKILRDLWIRTYKGTDIDYIAIKSDMNTQAKGNRSYNYRVVMYKTGIELDMRGRCSAGQKVLTSILIRLALAECFGSNCGIIALDEPTTNLDSENTESLAESLSKIIEFRKDQKNFQLIVITHDEKFLSHINGGKFIDNFYKVQRDENQFSTIKSLPIQYMQEE